MYTLKGKPHETFICLFRYRWTAKNVLLFRLFELYCFNNELNLPTFWYSCLVKHLKSNLSELTFVDYIKPNRWYSCEGTIQKYFTNNLQITSINNSKLFIIFYPLLYFFNKVLQGRFIKGTVSRDFRPWVFFHQIIPPGPLILLRIRRDIIDFRTQKSCMRPLTPHARKYFVR
jgi:hypothetical protein